MMKLLTSFEELPTVPLAFTIGAFDGVHRGHLALLSKLKSFGAPTCILTFDEHPLKTLTPDEAPLALTPLPVKLALLNVDYCLLLPFTKELSNLSYNELLSRIPISHFVLGKGDAFGKGRQGTEEAVRTWAGSSMHIEYIDKIPGISSRQIRSAIQAGDLTTAEKLLGHPHLLFAPSQRFSAQGLCLPPDGTYPLSPEATATIQKNTTIELSIPLTTPTLFSFKEKHHVF